jgi:hypothetical protein
MIAKVAGIAQIREPVAVAGGSGGSGVSGKHEETV